MSLVRPKIKTPPIYMLLKSKSLTIITEKVQLNVYTPTQTNAHRRASPPSPCFAEKNGAGAGAYECPRKATAVWLCRGAWSTDVLGRESAPPQCAFTFRPRHEGDADRGLTEACGSSAREGAWRGYVANALPPILCLDITLGGDLGKSRKPMKFHHFP